MVAYFDYARDASVALGHPDSSQLTRCTSNVTVDRGCSEVFLPVWYVQTLFLNYKRMKACQKYSMTSLTRSTP